MFYILRMFFVFFPSFMHQNFAGVVLNFSIWSHGAFALQSYVIPARAGSFPLSNRSSLPVVSHHLHQVVHMYTGLWPPKFSNKFVLCDKLSLTIIILFRNTSKDYF